MAVEPLPHTDEMYRIDPPAITLFHVIKQSRFGGESTLVDEAQVVDIAEVNVSKNEVDLQRGQHLATIGNCNNCHGSQFEGKDFIN